LRYVAELNRVYRALPALHAVDFSPDGFEWISTDDAESSVIAFLRKPGGGGAPVLAVCNLTPVPRTHYRLGVPASGWWREVVNSDAVDFGGSGWGNLGGASTDAIPIHGRAQSLSLTLPPLSTLLLEYCPHVNDTRDSADERGDPFTARQGDPQPRTDASSSAHGSAGG
jgi:1,4-alpha-glucan branching enzyme